MPVLRKEGKGDTKGVVAHGEVAVTGVGDAPCGSHRGAAEVGGSGERAATECSGLRKTRYTKQSCRDCLII